MNSNLLYNRVYEKVKNLNKSQIIDLLISREREKKTLKKELEESNKIIEDIACYLEYYLIDNMRYKDSQKEFHVLLNKLKK